MNLFKIIDDLQQIDGEAIDRLEHASRRSFISNLGKLGTKAAAVAAPIAVASVFNKATAQSAMAVEVLKFALTLEYLEAEFYTMGLNRSGLIPANRRDMFDQIRKHEVAHVKLLEGALGLTANQNKPNFNFSAAGIDPFASYENFVFLAHAFEDLGVRAYKGQAGNLINDDAILETALRIHSVEARHAAVVRRELSDLRNDPNIKAWITNAEGSPAPIYAGEDNTTHAGVNIMGIAGKSKEAVTEAFDEPLTKEAVLAIAGPFIVM
ncbi:ferritin-like domain-containing protein [Telluribacter sp. SYSU D00476]|uniref:ferritin-like domain-containing protein n=1 Tax=Telluribacter sp. SYSU D00476 TaxID=2811430 RepID=UPI001FF4460F|nr:ferritin-like domain-containing protein [Telluribacter sp. SYSU D00476]